MPELFVFVGQQPEGPAVVTNVASFLVRFRQLGKSEEPGARDAYDALVARGLNAQLVESTRTLIAKLNVPTSDDDGLAALIETATARREAYEELMLWYNDWATTLRSELGYHDLVRLGLRDVKGGRRVAEADDEEELPEEDEAA